MAITTPDYFSVDAPIELSDAVKTSIFYIVIAAITAPIAIFAAIQTGDLGLFEECFEIARCASQ